MLSKYTPDGIHQWQTYRIPAQLVDDKKNACPSHVLLWTAVEGSGRLPSLRNRDSRRVFVVLLLCISLVADEPQRPGFPIPPTAATFSSCLQAEVTKDPPIYLWFSLYDFLLLCKFSTLTTRQPMVEIYLLSRSLTLSVTEKKENNFCLSQELDLPTSVLAGVRGYLLLKDHSATRDRARTNKRVPFRI